MMCRHGSRFANPAAATSWSCLSKSRLLCPCGLNGLANSGYDAGIGYLRAGPFSFRVQFGKGMHQLFPSPFSFPPDPKVVGAFLAFEFCPVNLSCIVCRVDEIGE